MSDTTKFSKLVDEIWEMVFGTVRRPRRNFEGMMMKKECDGMILGNNKMVHLLFYKGNDYLRKGEFIKANENICDLIQMTTKE